MRLDEILRELADSQRQLLDVADTERSDTELLSDCAVDKPGSIRHRPDDRSRAVGNQILSIDQQAWRPATYAGSSCRHASKQERSSSTTMIHEQLLRKVVIGVAFLATVLVLAGCDSDSTAGGVTSTTGQALSTTTTSTTEGASPSTTAPSPLGVTTSTIAVPTPPPDEPETATTGVESSNVVLPPEECVAEPVTEQTGDTIVALGLCGGPPLFDHVLYPIAPADTVRDALQLLVDGTGEALLVDGVWTGFDRIPQETRQQLNVETELDSTGELTITIDLDGEPWQPPAELRSGPTDYSFFSIPILWTAFSDPAVERVTDPICLVPSGNFEQEICPDSFRLEFEDFVESQWQIDAECTYTWWSDEACRDDG